jgi:hypothetical protein
MDPATIAMLAKAGMQIGSMAIEQGKGYAAGKQAERVGEHNERQSAQDRLKARLLNEDPDQQGNRGAESTEKGKDASAGRSRADTIFANQLDQSSKRADLQNTMALTDQVTSYKRGEQLADNYLDASNAQALASGNIMSSIMNRGATQYRSAI